MTRITPRPPSRGLTTEISALIEAPGRARGAWANSELA